MSENEKAANWWIYKGNGEPHDDIEDPEKFCNPPSWRRYKGNTIERNLGSDPQFERRFSFDESEGKKKLTFEARRQEIELVNAALLLRRPLLITGKPGTGKSTLAYAVAHELNLGPVLRWSITSKSSLQDGLYKYDAIGRLQDAARNAKRIWNFTGKVNEDTNIGDYLRLGTLGTALLPVKKPRVLLIDEIDKSNIDLPNDLLNIFEEGEYSIPELERISKEIPEVQIRAHDGKDLVSIKQGYVQCSAFPFVVLTSNGERELPPAFLRRCIRLNIEPPDQETLAKIVNAHFGENESEKDKQKRLIEDFVNMRKAKGALATDQLLNAIYLLSNVQINLEVEGETKSLKETLFRDLGI